MIRRALHNLLDVLSQKYSANTGALAEIEQVRGLAQSPDLPHLAEATCRSLQLAFALLPTVELKNTIGACVRAILSWNRPPNTKATLTIPGAPGVVLVKESNGLFQRWRPALFCSHPSSDATIVREAIWRCARRFGLGQFMVNENIAKVSYPNSEEVLEAVDDCLDRDCLSDVAAYLVLSCLLLTSCRYDRATKCADGACTLTADTARSAEGAWAHEIASWSYRALGRRQTEIWNLDHAEKAYKRLTQLMPEDALAWVELGVVLDSSQQPDDARVSFERALELDPTLSVAWIGLARSYCVTCDLSRAEKVLYDGMKECGEQHAGFHFELACVSAKTHKLEAKKEALENTVSLEPDWPRPWFALGVTLRKLGDSEAAVRALRRAAVLGMYEALAELTSLDLKLGLFGQAVADMSLYLRHEVARFWTAPLYWASQLKRLRNLKLLIHYDLVKACNCGRPPGTGQGIVDQYLLCVQQTLLDSLESGGMAASEAVDLLRYVVVVWSVYADHRRNEELSRQFIREQLFTIEHRLDHLPEDIRMASGLASAWPELKARIDATSDEEFAREMLRLEPDWLGSVGRSQGQGQVQDLRWRLKGNLWVHLFEYQRSPDDGDLERIHYYMELLKGHTVLHKLMNPKAMASAEERETWNRYIASLPVKIERTAIADLQVCIGALPDSAIGLSFYFLHRDLLPTILVIMILQPGCRPQLKVLEGPDRLDQFKLACKRLKAVHQEVALREKTHGVGMVFRKLVGQEDTLSGRALIEAVIDWQKVQLQKIHGAILEGVVDLEHLRGKDLYISPSPEMYDVPFGLLYKDSEFLIDVVNSITIVPAFSLRCLQKVDAARRQDAILNVDLRWRDVAEQRAKSLSDGDVVVQHGLESDPSTFGGNTEEVYGQWLRCIAQKRRVHAIDHHDPSQWEWPTLRRPNLGDFGRYLYEAPRKPEVELLSLEACWAGTWSAPESLMGLFVSFLASGVSQVIASPYPVVPAETSGRLFEKTYSALYAGKDGRHPDVAAAIAKAARDVRSGKGSLEDTIPTLWGALQAYAAL